MPLTQKAVHLFGCLKEILEHFLSMKPVSGVHKIVAAAVKSPILTYITHTNGSHLYMRHMYVSLETMFAWNKNICSIELGSSTWILGILQLKSIDIMVLNGTEPLQCWVRQCGDALCCYGNVYFIHTIDYTLTSSHLYLKAYLNDQLRVDKLWTNEQNRKPNKQDHLFLNCRMTHAHRLWWQGI